MRAALVRTAVLVAGVGLLGILLCALLSNRRSYSGSAGGVFYAGTTNERGGTTLVLFKLLNPRERSVVYTWEHSETRNRADEEWARIPAADTNTVLVPGRSEGLFRVPPPTNVAAWWVVFRHEELPRLSGRVLNAAERLLGGSGDRGITMWLSSPEMRGTTPAPNEGAPPNDGPATPQGNPDGLRGGRHR